LLASEIRVTYIGRNTLLANRAWFDTEPLAGFEWIDVAPDESHAANALALGDTVIFPASFPRTRDRLEARGFHVTPIDISELQKAESGLTCSSLLFDAAQRDLRKFVLPSRRVNISDTFASPFVISSLGAQMPPC